MDRRYMFMETVSSVGCLARLWAIYMYMSIIFFSETATRIKAKLNVEHR